MKKYLLALLMLVLMSGRAAAAQGVRYSDYFTDKTMRIDYNHMGSAKKEKIALDTIYEGGVWAGSHTNLVDTSKNGRCSATVRDVETGEILFLKRFDTYFGEYQSTDPAIAGVERSYHESVLIPYPKKKVKFIIEKLDSSRRASVIFETVIDPSDIKIVKETPSSDVKVVEVVKNGPPSEKVDIVVVAEGYKKSEFGKFKKDLKYFSGVFFDAEPYKGNKERFNFTGVFKASEENGTDEPSYGSFRNTALNSSFDSLGSARYLMTEDNRSLRNIAGHAPYDAIIIMANHKRYGGGGIYNLYSVLTTDNRWKEYLFLHEFGHSFAGLADEYYTSSTSYNDFYPRGSEPAEPNITALLKPAELKWKALSTAGTPVPTPWEKAEYDKMDMGYQKIRQEKNKKIAEAKRSGAPREEVEKLEAEEEALAVENAARVDDYFSKSKFKNMVGAFEGAGYSMTGLYRPSLDCIMFSKGKKPFCPVCRDAIVKKIDSYTHDGANVINRLNSSDFYSPPL